MIPLILGAIAIGSAVFGGAMAAGGISYMDQAKEIGEEAQKRQEVWREALEEDWEATNALAAQYGQLQLNVITGTIKRFVAFIESIGQQNKEAQRRILEGLEGISIPELKKYKAAVIEAEQVLMGSAKSIGSAALGYTGAMGGAIGFASSVGVASTGTAIGSLSGAAATNATLAWLGGGSLAAGGGGMALGSVVLGGITLGPAVLIGGFVLAGEGEKALTKARNYQAEVNVAIAQIEDAMDCLKQIRQRIDELSDLVVSLNERAKDGLKELESIPSFNINSDKHISKLQKVMLLVKALGEIIKTPILDDRGKLNPITANIREKYRNL